MDPQVIDNLIAANPGGWQTLWGSPRIVDLGSFTTQRVEKYSSETDGYLDMVILVTFPGDAETVRYFRKSGWDEMWGTTTWNGPITEVEPQEKTVVVYVDKVA